jgi:hypothetical protein
MISLRDHFAELVERGVCQLEYPLKGGKPAMPKKITGGVALNLRAFTQITGSVRLLR